MGRKPSWFYKQSAVIPYRVVEGEIEIMLITSIRRRRWIIPKGIIEPHLSAKESARKEALEEAGVMGEVMKTPIGKYRRKKWGGKCSITVYLMEVRTVLDMWPEQSLRNRRWMKVKAAAGLVRDSRLRKLILAVPDAIKRM